MQWLNYHHLYYFWQVGKAGSVQAAARGLRLTPPTVSAQIHRLEAALGHRLIVRRGRGVALTAAGRLAYEHAEEIFSRGEALRRALGTGEAPSMRVLVGAAAVVPRPIVRQVLAPALALAAHVTCAVDGRPTELLAELAAGHLDLVLSDAPAGPFQPVVAFNHRIFSGPTVWLASAALRRRLGRSFPSCLNGAPLLAPTRDSMLRRSLDQWCEARRVRPQVVAELADSALIYACAEEGLGICAAPSALADELGRRHRLQRVGQARGLRQRFFAITTQRSFDNAAVAAICRPHRDH